MVDATTVPHSTRRMPVHGLRVDVVRGPDTGLTCTAHGDSVTIGTAAGNSLRLTDETVSRYHVEISHEGDRILVQDHGSTNGTVVGSVSISTAIAAPGTILQLGRTSVRIEAAANTVELELYQESQLGDLRGRSPAMLALMAHVARAAGSEASILLIGETGSGKEVVARAIHEASARRSRSFETVDCGALAPTLIASELLGHEKGAFTGADRQHVGAFERANGGTLFLDEIGELPASLQPTLLGALERRSFRRIGGNRTINVDVRVVSATNRDLRREVNGGSFREDLYYRLAVVHLRVPPLRERLEDIPLLVEHFMREAGHDGEIDRILPPSVMDGLMQHRWPGNVRELRNFVDATLAMGIAPSIDPDDIPRDGSSFPSLPPEHLVQMSFKEARALLLDDFEKMYVTALLDRCQGNVSEAARVSQVHRSYLNRMLQRHRFR